MPSPFRSVLTALPLLAEPSGVTDPSGPSGYSAHLPVIDSVGMALSSRPLWPRTHRASSRFTWEDMSCAGTRGSVPGERGPYFLESFFSLLVTRVFCGQNHGCQHSRGQHKHLGSLLEICGTLRSRKFQ